MVVIENLVKEYGDFKLDVSMNIPEGRVTAIVGKNGAGKSTTIKSMLGLVSIESGSVKVLGKDVKELTLKDKEKIGVTLSDSGFSMYLNANDINHILKKMYKEHDMKMFEDYCKKQRIDMKKPLKDYSTGMKAKIRVITAMTHKAKLLIMDEPTSGLDVGARNEILDMIREYLVEDESRSVLVSSHISSDLESICDDLYLINDGKIVLHEEICNILDQYAILKVDEAEYDKLDKEYIVNTKKEKYGITCLTNQKQYYAENYPNIVIENGNIDDLILMMTGGM